ncbi:PhoU domain-containing protein, partial [Clostridium perfringens]
MGGLAEDAITQAILALQRPDTALARRVDADDKAIDAIEREVERLAVRIIA